ncbi:hypothetical protein BVY04_02230 [bacterium M21]|nr:hypothetical protein BVY04_02230 [bacterium M21]
MKMTLGVIVATTLLFSATLNSKEAVVKTDRETIPFTMSKSGHILITVKINNRDAHLVVDTAAGTSVIHTKQTKSLKLKTSKGNSVARGLGTSSHVIKNVGVPVMTIGTVQYHNPYFIALNLSHVEAAGGKKGFHGLLGSPFLQKYAAIINYEKKTISLKRPEQKNNKAYKAIDSDKK